MGVFKEMGNPKSALPLSLEKGEIVTLQKIENYKTPTGSQTEYALIKIAGGQEGYVQTSYLARAGLVVTGDVKLYQRPSITSGLAPGGGKVKSGTVAFIENEDFSDGEWFEVTGGSNSKNYFKGWLKGSTGVSKDTELVTAAVRFEQASEVFANPKSPARAKEEAKATLDDLRKNAAAPINQLASDMLTPQPVDNPPTPETNDKKEETPTTTPASENR